MAFSSPLLGDRKEDAKFSGFIVKLMKNQNACLSLITWGIAGTSCGTALRRHCFLSFFQKCKLIVSFPVPSTFKSWKRQPGELFHYTLRSSSAHELGVHGVNRYQSQLSTCGWASHGSVSPQWGCGAGFTALVSQGCRDKEPQIEQLKKQKFIVSRFWRLDVDSFRGCERETMLSFS